MNWEVIGAISAFIASVATLLTLFYLAMQLRESNKLARSAALKSVIDSFLDNTVRPAIENPLHNDLNFRGHASYEDLSSSEQSIFETMIVREALHLQNAMQQHEHGLIDKVDYNAWLAYFVSNIKSPGGQKAWEVMKVSITPTVVAASEKYMADNPSSPSWVEMYDHRYRDS
jgi:hypothetical protein